MTRIRSKKQFLPRLKNDRGSVLLMTYMVVMLLSFLGAAFVVLSGHEGRASEIQRKVTQAFYIAEAGIERAIYDLRQDFVNAADPDNPSWADGAINGIVFAYHGNNEDSDDDGVLDAGEDADSDSLLDPHYVSLPYTGTSLNDGSYAVSLMNVSGADDIWIRSTGTIGSISQTIQMYVRVINLSPWSNAIFGGAGAAGAMVSGNVNINGSVHILGDGLAAGDNAINLGGTAELVGNNYSDLDSGLADRVPALPTTVLNKGTANEETVETLFAELRVKNGMVGLSGSSTVGQADVFGDSDKETVDGVYISDGYSGNKGADNVYSDNGTSTGYDLGDSVSFPSLSDPIGAYANYAAFFTAEGYTPTGGVGGEMDTLADLTPSTPNFTYGATGDCNVDVNCIEMVDGKLYIKGKIYINGGTLGFSGGQMEYTGSGTILVTGDVTINKSLVTPTPDTDAFGDPIPNFPVDAASGQSNVIGIMTPGNIRIGKGAGAANLEVMGLFYAETEIEIAKQTDLVGTIVTNYFNLSEQVPSIFQVPETADNLPDGMLSSDPVFFMKIISWQKI